MKPARPQAPARPRRRVAVIGAGLAGLAVAHEIVERGERLPEGLELRCYEASGRAGGVLGSAREEGFLHERAANGFLDGAPQTLTLLRRLGLEERLVRANADAARRFVLRRGRLVEIPRSPSQALVSSILSWAGKLRALAEPLVPARRGGADESVEAFFRRRLGAEAAQVLADALVTGTWAGDPGRLSALATFPRLAALEQEHGGLLRGLVAARRGGGPGTLASFRDGMQELVDALVDSLGTRLVLRSRLDGVSDLGARGLRLHHAEGAPEDVDAVVLACPAAETARIVERMDPDLAAPLRAIPRAPVAVVHLGYRREALGRAPEGFGFLVPRGERRRLLGAIWASNLFPERASERALLATIFLGGARDPEAATLDDRALVRLAREELGSLLDVQVAPYFERLARHPEGIPQYELGHVDRLASIDRRVAAHRGLYLAGSSYRGVSVNACLEEAPRVAEALLGELAGRAVRPV